jgi:hypothetical protein
MNEENLDESYKIYTEIVPIVHSSESKLICEICSTEYQKEGDHVTTIPHILAQRHLQQTSKASLPHAKSIGYQLLLKEGWNPDKGLGKNEDGRTSPLHAVMKLNKAGIGNKNAPVRLIGSSTKESKVKKTKTKKELLESHKKDAFLRHRLREFME